VFVNPVHDYAKQLSTFVASWMKRVFREACRSYVLLGSRRRTGSFGFGKEKISISRIFTTNIQFSIGKFCSDDSA